MKRKLIYTILGIIILLIIIPIIYFVFLKDKTIDSGNRSPLYNNEYYTAELPDKITAQNKDDHETALYIDNKKAGSITVNPDCSYCSNTSSILSNYIGMHAYAKGKIIEKDNGTYKMAKVMVGFEQSAAQQIKGESKEPDQLHYFFTNSNNLMIDLYIDTELINEETADSIAASFKLK